MEAINFSETSVDLQRIRGVLSKKIELFNFDEV
jgi:hypothetical protein